MSSPKIETVPQSQVEEAPWWRFQRWWMRCLFALLVLLVIWQTPGWGAWFANQQARAALREREEQRAWNWLEWSARFDSRNGEAEFLRGRVKRRQGQMHEVRSHLEKALRWGYSPETVRREEYLALAQNGQLAEALPYLARLLQDPQDDGAEICEAYVCGYYRARQLGKMFELIEPWIKDFPDDPQPYYFRGGVYKELMRYKQAEADFRQALKIKPDYHTAAYELGEVLLVSQQPEEALSWLQQGEKAPNVRMDAWIAQANALKTLSRYEEARKKLDEALKIDGASPQAQLALGQLELDSGHPQEALNALDLAMKEIPTSRELHQARALALRNLKRIDEAQKEFAWVSEARAAQDRAQSLIEVIQKNPNNVKDRVEIGRILIKYGIATDGLIWLQSALNLDPDNVTALEIYVDYYQSKASLNENYAALAEQFKTRLIQARALQLSKASETDPEAEKSSTSAN